MQEKQDTELRALIQEAVQAGNTEKAITLYQKALEKARAVQDRRAEARILFNSGNIHMRLQHLPQALECYIQAAPLYRSLGLTKNEASAWNRMGSIYGQTGQPEKALDAFQKALPLYRTSKDTTGELRVLQNLGVLASMTGQPKKALEYLEQTLPAYRALGDQRREAVTLTDLGNTYRSLNHFQRALTYYEQALPLLKATGDKKNEGATLNNLGTLYDLIGQPQRAREYYEQALPLFRETNEKAFEANALTNLGLIEKGAGQLEKALAYLRQALPLYQAVGDKRGEATGLHSLGAIYLRLNQPQQALAYFQQALPLFQSTQFRSGEGTTLASIGATYQKLAQPQKALGLYQEALAIHQALGDRTAEVNDLVHLAQIAETSHQPAAAEAHLAQAVTVLELLRTRLGGLTESKSILLTSTLDAYYAYLQLLLARGKTEQAFAVAQKTKARMLLDLMAAGRVPFDSELTPAEREQERALRQKADQLNQAMVREGVENQVGAKKRYAALRQELAKTESQLRTLTETLYARHPRLAQKRSAQTATLARLAPVLPPTTALLEYIVLSDDTLVLFVVRKRAVQALTLRLRYTELVAAVRAFRAACSDPRQEYRSAASELYQRLLAPAEKHLAGITALVLCPDGALWDVPFAALLNKEQFLAQRFTLSYAYSATSALAAQSIARPRPAPQRLLVVANPDFGASRRFGDLKEVPGQRPIDSPSRPIDSPSRPIDSPSRPIDIPSRAIDTASRAIDTTSRAIDTPSRAIDSASRAGRITPLPGTQREADMLQKRFPEATLLTGAKAQESTTKAQIGNYRYLHFATHGFVNDAAPMLSSLVLAQPNPTSNDDGFLTAREIFELDIKAELAVLSACNTARGENRTGEGMIGLTWALFVAGCPTQVVSQWAVDDASTALLMQRFYAELPKGKATALRMAALSLQREPRYQHPYYWAPFVLMGDGR